MITFIPRETTEALFSDVREDQFFVCSRGNLCQKDNDSQFIVIANHEGVPMASSISCDEDMPIRRTLGHVERIRFEP